MSIQKLKFNEVLAAHGTDVPIGPNCLSGERTSGDQNWQPAYMAFPMKAYTERGGIDAIDQWNSVKELFPPAA